MPQMTQADFEESEGPIETCTEQQIYEMETLLTEDEKNSNLLTAFYLGLYCGLRISEVFAVRRRSVDRINGTITVNRQIISTQNSDLIKRTQTIPDEIYKPGETTLPDGTKVATAPKSDRADATRKRQKHIPQKKL